MTAAEKRDGCVYCRAGVECHLPAMYGKIPPQCQSCGWNPAIQPARKAQARERLRRKVQIKPRRDEGIAPYAGGGETK